MIEKMAELVVTVRGKTRTDVPKETDYLTRQITGEREPLTPLGSIFEINTMVFLIVRS